MSNIKAINDKTTLNNTNLKASSFDIDQYSLFLQRPLRLKSPIAWVKHIPFAYFAMEILKPKIFVELGVHTGNSYSAFCQAVSILKTKTACYGVDTWKGDEHAQFYDDSIFNELNEYNSIHYSEFSSLIRGTFDDALQYFSNNSIDLLHIDGFHTYEAVKHDFETWLPKMSNQGVILMHDTCVRANNFGVWKFFEELKQNFPTIEFLHGHGLGVVLVGNNIDKNFLRFVEAVRENDFYLTFFAKLGDKIADEFIINEKDISNITNEKINNLNSEINSLKNEIDKEKSTKFTLLNQIDALENKITELELRRIEQDKTDLANLEELERIKNSFFWRFISLFKL